MNTIFLSYVNPFMRLIVLTSLIGCGSVQTINGVRVRQPERISNGEVCMYVFSFGMGYFIVDNYTKKK